MRIILRERTHTREAVQLTALLIPIDGTELRTAERQVFVRTRRVLVDRAVVRTVHRFEQIDLTFLRRRDGLERVLAVMIPVTGSHIQVLRTDMRRDDLLITVTFLNLLEEVLQTQTKGSTFR